jgi:hypothetical protein
MTGIFSSVVLLGLAGCSEDASWHQFIGGGSVTIDLQLGDWAMNSTVPGAEQDSVSERAEASGDLFSNTGNDCEDYGAPMAMSESRYDGESSQTFSIHICAFPEFEFTDCDGVTVVSVEWVEIMLEGAATYEGGDGTAFTVDDEWMSTYATLRLNDDSLSEEEAVASAGSGADGTLVYESVSKGSLSVEDEDKDGLSDFCFGSGIDLSVEWELDASVCSGTASGYPSGDCQ